MRTHFLILLLVGLLASCTETGLAQSQTERPTVVVLSMDGFRWDYPKQLPLPNFERLARSGVVAERLQPSFPSKTFPNHYSIATGLYPGHHGLVNNTFTEATSGLVYKIGDRSAVENPIFYGGEPIWNTAEKAGLRSACFFWVGSEAPVQGMYPSIWKKYDHKFSWNARIDTVIAWLQRPMAQRPQLIMWYLPEPDGTGHDHGPYSKELRTQLLELDAFLGRFLDRLNALPHADQIDFILTTDHGMGEVRAERTIELADWIDEDQLIYGHHGDPVSLVQPKPEHTEAIYQSLKQVEHLQVYKKGECPAYWYYSEHPNIPELVLVADSAWSLRWKGTGRTVGGAHGYDPRNTDMHGIFYATGPHFRQGIVHPPFENVDIYPLLAHILGITPAPTDGRLDRVLGLLRQP